MAPALVVRGMLSTPSLSSLQGSLWPEVVAPDRAQSSNQIELFDTNLCSNNWLMLDWIIRTVWPFNWVQTLSHWIVSDTYVVHSIGFQNFFVQAFKIVIDSWKFSILLLYMLWDDWPIFMISGSNEHLQQEMKCTLLKPDYHSWWMSKIQSGLEDTLEERYAIKFCFKLGKMPEERMECFRLLLGHFAWIEHQFLSGIRDSRKTGSLWGMMGGVGGVRKSIHQSWLAKGLGLGLLCWGFKGVQEEIPCEEASTLQIGSVAFPIGQSTSPQFHLCHRLFDQDGHQDTFSPSL